MGYGPEEAWSDEKSLGDWPFGRWKLGDWIALRSGYEYCQLRLPSVAGVLHYRAVELLGPPADNSLVRRCMEIADETVDLAIHEAEAEARAAWLSGTLWLPSIDETLDGGEDLADLIIQCCGITGEWAELPLHRVLAGVAIWCLGEWRAHAYAGDSTAMHWALGQASS